MAVTVRANSKDENYFAPAPGWTTRTSTSKGAMDGRIGKTGDWRAHFMNSRRATSPWDTRRDGRGNDYCFLPVKVPSPNCPSDTLPLIVLPSVVLPEYFTARD